MSEAVSFLSLLVWFHPDERGVVRGDRGMRERRRWWGWWDGGSDRGREGGGGGGRVMEGEDEEEDYGCSSAQPPASPGGPAGPIGPSLPPLLISTQRALCQKSDTVRALWTSSPFKSTQRAFLCCEPRGLRACNDVRLCVLLFVWGSEGALMDREESDERNLAH